MNEIPLISEVSLLDIIDDVYYKVYPTTVHRDRKSPWFFPGRELRAHIENCTKINHEIDMALM